MRENISRKPDIENKYFEWYRVEPNKSGFTNWLHDKIKDEWYIVHATNTMFKAEKVGNELIATTTLVT